MELTPIALRFVMGDAKFIEKCSSVGTLKLLGGEALNLGSQPSYIG